MKTIRGVVFYVVKFLLEEDQGQGQVFQHNSFDTDDMYQWPKQNTNARLLKLVLYNQTKSASVDHIRKLKCTKFVNSIL